MGPVLSEDKPLNRRQR